MFYWIFLYFAAKKLVNKAKMAHKRVASAESCTGGMFASYITAIGGSSKMFDCSIVTYSNKSKMELLKVSPEIIEEHGAVSKECAIAMLSGLLDVTGVDFGVAITGIAGPNTIFKNKSDNFFEDDASQADDLLNNLGRAYSIVNNIGLNLPQQQNTKQKPQSKPKGLVYVAYGSKDKIDSIQLHLKGNRQQIRRQACLKALKLLTELI